MAKHRQDPAKESRWRARFKRHATSGLSVRVFCRRERVTESAFYFWRRVIAERDGENAPPAHVCNESTAASEPKTPAAPTFVPATVTGACTGGMSIAIELSGGYILRLPESISASRLAELVHAIESRGAP